MNMKNEEKILFYFTTALLRLTSSHDFIIVEGDLRTDFVKRVSAWTLLGGTRNATNLLIHPSTHDVFPGLNLGRNSLRTLLTDAIVVGSFVQIQINIEGVLTWKRRGIHAC